MQMKAFLVYSPGYNVRIPGLSWLHPFDGSKYGHAWSTLQKKFGAELEALLIIPDGEVSLEDLLVVHTRDYIDSLRHSTVVARALEIATARLLPSLLLDRSILRPMRLATQGTIQAVDRALEGCAVFNLGGGYHHAFADHGEGFCIYADAAIAVTRARKSGRLGAGADVLMIDLDAHRGNGIEHIFRNDPHVHFFDMYNFQIYPGYSDTEDEYLIPVPAGSSGAFYLNRLKKELPAFLASVTNPKLVIYNAGTDILAGDPLGGLNVTEEEVRQRDRYVLAELTRAEIPVVMLTSGGYTKRSAGLIADAASFLINSGN